MKTDIDSLLEASGADALWVTGASFHNPPMYYFTGPAHLGRADIFKMRGRPPVLFHAAMERDEALRTGIITKSLSDYRMNDLMRAANGDLALAGAMLYERIFTDIGLTKGRVVVTGMMDAGAALAVITALKQRLPEVEFISDSYQPMLSRAMATKDSVEVGHIRQMGKVTVEVVGLVAELLTSHRVKDGVLVRPGGDRLTIGDVRRRINWWLAERGAENPHGTIFSVGYDSAVPHSTGKDDDPLPLGKTIVFDIYPCQGGGGYFYDFTRTWSLGYATDEVLKVYQDVREAYDKVTAELRVGETCRRYQEMTCEIFESKGYPTVRSNPQTERGYVHGLGHGVGLNIHERPSFSTLETVPDRLEPGAVFTIEPGLYDPERGWGVRLEDTYTVLADGSIEKIAEYPMDLILPVKA